MLSNRLLERTEATSALSCELKESRRAAEIRENKLKAQAKEEITRMEKVIHQEKVSQAGRCPYLRLCMYDCMAEVLTCMWVIRLHHRYHI